MRRWARGGAGAVRGGRGVRGAVVLALVLAVAVVAAVGAGRPAARAAASRRVAAGVTDPRVAEPGGAEPGGAAAGRAAAGTAARSGSASRRRIGKVVRAIEALRLPGGVISVSGRGTGRYSRAFGVAAPGRRMTLRDHFRIGSITKTFTATVILKLVQRHRLSLGDRLSRWEPRVPDARRVTIRMLLDMRSGIWDEGGTGPTGQSLLTKWTMRNCRDHNPVCGRKVWTPQEIVNLAIRQGRAYPPGVYYYSDTNYVLLAMIAQRVTHKPFARLLRRFVLRPLHLRHTSFPTASLAMPRPATTGYALAGGRYRQVNQVNPSALFGAGNIISTLGDLRRWARALATGALLAPRLQRQRLRMVLAPGGFQPLAGTGITTGLVYRYGLGIADLANMLGHNGAVPGYTAEMWYLPSRRGTVIELFNSITQCGTEFASDAANSALAQAAFGDALYRSALPAATCPVPR